MKRDGIVSTWVETGIWNDRKFHVGELYVSVDNDGTKTWVIYRLVQIECLVDVDDPEPQVPWHHFHFEPTLQFWPDGHRTLRQKAYVSDYPINMHRVDTLQLCAARLRLDSLIQTLRS